MSNAVSSCNLVEMDAHKLKARGQDVTFPVKPSGLATLKIQFAP